LKFDEISKPPTKSHEKPFLGGEVFIGGKCYNALTWFRAKRYANIMPGQQKSHWAYLGVAVFRVIEMDKQAAVAVAEPTIETRRCRRTKDDKKPRRQPRYQVILWNDEDHSYAYVIVMLMELFGHPAEKGYQLAKDVDANGRTAVLTTTLEHAELKRDQIHAFGRDGLIDVCCGSMWSTIEPIEAG